MTHGLAVVKALALNAEGSSGSRAGGEGKLGPGIDGEHPAKVIAKAPTQSFVVKSGGPLGVFPKLRRRPAPRRHTVGLLVFEGSHHSFSGSHLHLSTSSGF